MNQRKLLDWIAFLLILILMVCALYLGREFTKIRTASLYILDLWFLIWAVIAFSSGSWKGNIPWKSLLGPFLFFAWGCTRLLFDVLTVGFPTERVLQHCILFVYPLLWISVGVWISVSEEKFQKIMSGTVLVVGTAPFLWGSTLNNISIGPVCLIASFFCFVSRGKKFFATGMVLLVFAFLPTWLSWLQTMQRTVLVMTFFLIFAIPLMAASISVITKRAALLLIVSIIFVFLSGFAVTSIIAHYKKSGEISVKTIPRDFFQSMQHAEDKPDKITNEMRKTGKLSEGAKNQSPFQMRFRRFIWKQAILDWWENPVIGIGFFPEVPSMVNSDYKNDGGLEYPGAPPVSGPHNSYLSVLARTGIIGAILFLGMLLQWFSRAWKTWRAQTHFDWNLAMMILVPIDSMIHAFFNIGFEGPHNAMPGWIFFGMLLAQGRSRLTLHSVQGNRQSTQSLASTP